VRYEVVLVGANRDSDTPVTLFEQLQADPADSRAWNVLYERYYPLIRSWCLRWGVQAADADDISQDVLLKLFGAFRQYRFDPSRSFRAWLKTVTQHAWTDFARARLRTSDELAGQLEAFADSRDAVADLERQLEDALEHEMLEMAMIRVEERVKPKTWAAFRMTAIEHRSGVEAAEQLQMPVAHVFVAKHRVQKLLEAEVRILKGIHSR
jgi:RNA polymerase sigma factor (sigma-70 family)